MPRFIHSADVHLDSPLRRLEAYDGAPVDEIRGASRVALANLVQFAIDQAVDFVIIAGDLYDGDWRDQQTGLYFASQAAKLRAAGVPLYMIRGNHDAASIITRSMPLPNNPDGSAVILSTQAESVRLENLGVSIHGQSFGTRAENANFVAGYPPPDSGMFNIGLLHTSLNGCDGHDPYAPCTPQDLVDKRYQYWALGHIHVRGEHQPDGEAPIVFPGNLQGRHPRETGPKGCVVVDYDPSSGQTRRQFQTLDVVRWELCEIDAKTCETPDDLVDRFRTWAHAYTTSYDDGILIVRVRVVGVSPLHDHWYRRADAYEEMIRACGFEFGSTHVWVESLRIDSTLPKKKQAESLDLDGPISSIMQVFRELASERRDSILAGSQLERELTTLRNKLPSGLLESEFSELLREAQMALLARLRETQVIDG